jgi:hypothetical protein
MSRCPVIDSYEFYSFQQSNAVPINMDILTPMLGVSPAPELSEVPLSNGMQHKHLSDGQQLSVMISPYDPSSRRVDGLEMGDDLDGGLF